MKVVPSHKKKQKQGAVSTSQLLHISHPEGEGRSVNTNPRHAKKPKIKTINIDHTSCFDQYQTSAPRLWFNYLIILE